MRAFIGKENVIIFTENTNNATSTQGYSIFNAILLKQPQLNIQ